MSEQKMFRADEPRYLTAGIDAHLPVMYQILLWNTIDNLRDSGQQLDYLLVFDIQTKENPDRKGRLLIITHSQEQPPYYKQYVIPVSADSEMVNGKIFVIDNRKHATMLWADEY